MSIYHAPLDPFRYEKLMSVLKAYYDDRESRNIAFRLEEYLSELNDDEFSQALERLRQKEPWQYIAGKSWFYGLELTVDPSVLIPRQETEELVYLILQKHADFPPLKVLDIGTGSGCIPLAIQFNRPHWKTKGIDISWEALKLAEKNALCCGLSIAWEWCDILHQYPTGGPWDIIVSNPPYISTSEKGMIPDHVLLYEPPLALFAPEGDPLAFYRAIAEKGITLLTNDGKIYLEINTFRAVETMEIFQNYGYRDVVLENDLAGKPRFLSATSPE